MIGSLGSGVFCELEITEVIVVLGDASTESVDSEDEGTAKHRNLQSVFRICNKIQGWTVKTNLGYHQALDSTLY